MDREWAELVAEYTQPPASITEFVQSPLYLNLGDEVYPEVLRTLGKVFGVDEGGKANGNGPSPGAGCACTAPANSNGPSPPAPLPQGEGSRQRETGGMGEETALVNGIDWRNAARSTGVPCGNSTAASGCPWMDDIRSSSKRQKATAGAASRVYAGRPTNGKRQKATAAGWKPGASKACIRSLPRKLHAPRIHEELRSPNQEGWKPLKAAKCGRSQYDEVVLCWGIGSGKSYLASLAILYMAHQVLCLRDPQRHFGLSPGSQIALVIMGPSSRQVRNVIYSGIVEMVKRSPWFQRNFPPRSVRQDAMEFDKHVVIAAGNSTDTYVLGYNVLAAVIDEAAYLVESQDGRRQNADEMYTAVQRRIKSRFGNDGLLLIVSSPKHTTDFVERKLKEAESNPRIFASRKAVWEVKPPERFCGQSFEHKGRQIPIEFYEEFQRDAQRASRDLAAMPLGAYHALFVDMAPLYQACSEKLEHPVIDEHLQLADWFRNEGDARPRYVHVDLGLRHDACGIAMAVADVTNGEPTVTVELMTRFEPPPDGEIDLAKVREFIFALRERGFVIGEVSYDGFQSADSQQILRRRGFAAATVSVDRDMTRYQMLKELAYEGRLLLYRYAPFFEEAAQLEIVRGQKVDHPRGGSKDVTDAVAGAVSEAALAAGRGEIRGTVV